ncbi:molybdenum cofactor sulfurase [Alsobacter soli]|uniref:Molybdenum cofactor sulfurase n=1 Tax=Alsobacter soli TaxID=2109933 RepID=A0A2T1HXU8_9HYPH|nr:MOSC domain-containing protein [Alsobacter soli]PSC06522.1 molybdenum cofactor sulfurase [Alsobacter soli]
MQLEAITPARKLRAVCSSVLVADGDGFETRPVERATLDFEGIDGLSGERHRGHSRAADARTPWFLRGLRIRNTRQLSLVSREELSVVAEAMGLEEVRPEWLGANLVVEGIPSLSRLPRGTRMFFGGGAVLAIEEQNAPCRKSGKALARHIGGSADLAQRFVNAARRRRGLVAWVDSPGMIGVGDAVTVRIPEQWIY